MAERDVAKYPEGLIACTTEMLCNPRLLSLFVKVIFKRTNVHHPPSVVVTCETIAKWFRRLKKNKSSVPSNFDYTFFYKGLEILLEANHAIVTSKAIWMLYMVFHVFPTNQKIQVLDMISKKFYDLFFHWSWNIRNVFN